MYLACLHSARHCIKCWKFISGWPVIHCSSFEEESEEYTQTPLLKIKVRLSWSKNIGFLEGHLVCGRAFQGRCSLVLFLPTHSHLTSYTEILYTHQGSAEVLILPWKWRWSSCPSPVCSRFLLNFCGISSALCLIGRCLYTSSLGYLHRCLCLLTVASVMPSKYVLEKSLF